MDTKISSLPDSPGCYIFWDKERDCLYVGKSKNIRTRVRSYFSKNNPPKTQKLSTLIAHVEYIPADSELTALYLEHSLIKTYRPPFNSQMKKDFRPHYICIEWAHEKPGLYIHTRPGAEATRYGSFFSDHDARDAITLINRAWGIPICEKRHFGSRNETNKGCLNGHISRCIGPCMSIATDEYIEILKKTASFMQGKNKKAIREIKQEMNHAAESMDYEKAARLRDIINELQSLQKRFTYQVSFKDRRILVFIKGHHEDEFRLLYFENGELAHMEQFTCKDDTIHTTKLESFQKAMSKKIIADKLQETAKIYTSIATQEIRACKYYVDITKTPKAHLAKKLENAYLYFCKELI